ncbi:MAG: GerMN domain-containing protein [Goleter apudmare HA4340-LM2]|jgi:spore germination protein GerM|nr:GerMN domain-containing protein [Goleter apudmare HA4340-LM2]
MKDQQGSNRISSGVVASVAAAVVAVGGGVAWLTWQSSNSPTPSSPTNTIRQPGNSTQAQPGNERKADVYWLKPTDKSFNLVPQPIQVAATQPNQVLEKAFENLLAGPTEGSDSTTIPQGTKLLGLKAENDEVRVNLSEEFTSGGGSSSMMGRIGQVVYTATSLNENAKVYIDVDGKPLAILGGEGVELEQPLTRQTFKQNYPL